MIKELIPPSIKPIRDLIDAGDPIFSEFLDSVLNTLIYSRIDHLSGDILEILAHQFHIEGWDLAETEQDKRNLIKRAIELHRYKGTKWSVLNALSALGYETIVKEWFEYSGDPYRFKAYISNKPVQSSEEYQTIKRIIDEYKNERSWLDSIGTHHRLFATIKTGAIVWNGYRYIIGINYPAFYVEPQKTYSGHAYRIGMYTSIGVQNG